MPCDECGAQGCQGLLDQLLALEFERIDPYGGLHGVTVAAYGVQHPSRFEERVRQGQWELLCAFYSGGREAADRLQLRRIRRNSHRHHRIQSPRPRGAAVPTFPSIPHGWRTIADVLGPDGQFAPEGHTERVADWVSSIVTSASNE